MCERRKSYPAFASFPFIHSVNNICLFMAWQSLAMESMVLRPDEPKIYVFNNIFFQPICAARTLRSLPFLACFPAWVDVKLNEFFFLLAPAHFADLPIYRILSHNSLPKSTAIAIQLFITHFILQNRNIHIHGTSKFTPCFYACVSTLVLVLGVCASTESIHLWQHYSVGQTEMFVVYIYCRGEWIAFEKGNYN